MMQHQKINRSLQLELNIRQANLEDKALLVKWTYLLHHHEDDNTLEMHPHFKTNLSNWLSQEISNPNFLFLIAEVKQQAVGFIGASTLINDNGFLLAPIKGLINLLWIDESHRKKNIAEQLLKEVEKCFASIGITYIECNYTSNNKLAENFWTNKGYRQSSITARKILK